MTSQEHNRTLGIMHLVYGGIYLLMAFAMFAFIVPFVLFAPGGGGDEMGVAFFIGIMAFMLLFWLIFTVPSLIAGYGILKKKSWAKIWGITASVMEGMSFPLGTALCVYSMWFFLGEHGKAIYDKPAQASRQNTLHGAPIPDEWNAARSSKRQEEYAPPPEMPDWR